MFEANRRTSYMRNQLPIYIYVRQEYRLFLPLHCIGCDSIPNSVPVVSFLAPYKRQLDRDRYNEVVITYVMDGESME